MRWTIHCYTYFYSTVAPELILARTYVAWVVAPFGLLLKVCPVHNFKVHSIATHAYTYGLIGKLAIQTATGIGLILRLDDNNDTI